MPDPDLPLTHREVSKPFDGAAAAANVARGSRFALRTGSLHIAYLLLGFLIIGGVLTAVIAVAGHDVGIVVILVGVVAAWIWVGVFLVRLGIRMFRQGNKARP